MPGNQIPCTADDLYRLLCRYRIPPYLQLRIMGVPNYRELLARIILKSHYAPPPTNRAMYDALYQGVPFVMEADMDLRRIDAALDAARLDGFLKLLWPHCRNRWKLF